MTATASGWSLHRLLLVLANVLLLFAGLYHHGFAVMPFLQQDFVLMVPALATLGVLFWKPRPWAWLAAGLTTLPPGILVLFVFGALPALWNPAAMADFVTLLALVAAGLLGAAAGVAAFVATRAGRALPHASEGMTTRTGVLAMLGLALVLGMAGTSGLAANYAKEGGGTGGYDVEPEEVVVFSTKSSLFHPHDVAVKKGKLTELAIANDDNTFHTFTYEMGGKTYSHDLLPNQVSRILVRFDEAGEVPFWCAPHSAGASESKSGMVGTLVVA